MRYSILILGLCGVLAGCDSATSPTAASLGGGSTAAPPTNGASTGTGASSPQAIVISPNRVQLTIGASFQLTTNVAQTASLQVLWRSLAPSVASVSQAGLVIGLAPGTATVTARLASDTTVVGLALVEVTTTGTGTTGGTGTTRP